MLKPVQTTAALLLGLALVPGLALAELYRYENAQGITVLDHRIPPELVHKGYTVLSNNGRVLRVVPRSLTPVERAELEALKAARAEQDRQEELRLARDAELLRLYSSPEDVARARDRKVASIQSFIDTTRADIERLKVQKRNLELQAAEMERSGQSVSAEVINNITILNTKIREREAEIAARQTEQEDVRIEFNRDVERVRVLFEGPGAGTGR